MPKFAVIHRRKARTLREAAASMQDVTYPNGSKERMCNDCFSELMSPRNKEFNQGLRSQSVTVPDGTACPICRFTSRGGATTSTSPLKEREMTAIEKSKHDQIMRGLNAKAYEFTRRYGSEANNVMQATATKQVMGEDSGESLHQAQVTMSHTIVTGKGLRPGATYTLKSASPMNGHPTFQFHDRASNPVTRFYEDTITKWIKSGGIEKVKYSTMGPRAPYSPTQDHTPPTTLESISHRISEAEDSEGMPGSPINATTVRRTVVPLRYQAATLVADALGAAHVSGSASEFRLSSGSPEQVVDAAVRTYLRNPHSPESWGMAGRMLNMLHQMGVNWDDSGLRPAHRNLMGIASTTDTATPEANAPDVSTIPNTPDEPQTPPAGAQ